MDTKYHNEVGLIIPATKIGFQKMTTKYVIARFWHQNSGNPLKRYPLKAFSKDRQVQKWPKIRVGGRGQDQKATGKKTNKKHQNSQNWQQNSQNKQQNSQN